MPAFDASIYFAGRAPRYQEALRVCPDARVLDYLPYFAAFAAGGIDRLDNRLACDAFGGTGFLSRTFAKLGIRMVVADVCAEMLAGAADIGNVETHVTRDDFDSMIATHGEGTFDFVFTHGGLHHVVEGTGATPNVAASRARQSSIVARLSQLLKPRGILVVADIPFRPSEESPELLPTQKLDLSLIRQCSPATTRLLPPILGLPPSGFWTLAEVGDQVTTHLWRQVSYEVPRHFFDEFIAPYAPMGHVAVYPDFDEFHALLVKRGMQLLGRINFKGPWLFPNTSRAGWYFREKFSLYEPGPPSTYADTELSVYGALERYLGTRAAPSYTAVNWGITYAAYQAA